MSEVTTNSKMQLSEHFRLGEFTKSNYPEVYNIPSHVAIENMKRICGWLEILIGYARETQQDYDELFIEKNKYGRYWVHFAVRPKENRRKVAFLNG